MPIDFTTPVTIADLIAIILSVIAIAIQFIQWIWNKWGVKAHFIYAPMEQAILFFNQTAASVRIYGAFESENKPSLIKKVNLTVTRRKDESRLKLSWGSFISPTNYQVIGNQLTPTEIPHPLRVEADGILSIGIDFTDPSDAFGRTFRFKSSTLFDKIPIIMGSAAGYQQAKEAYQKLEEYAELKNFFYKEFFWDVGYYDLDIEVKFKKTSKHFFYTMSVSEQDNAGLLSNIDESLLARLKDFYRLPYNFYAPAVEMRELRK